MNFVLTADDVEGLLNSTISRNTKNFNFTLHTISFLLETKHNEGHVLEYIRKKLVCSENKEDVYEYLNSIISCISAETLFKHILFWMEHILAQNVDNKIKSKRFNIISALIQVGNKNEDFCKAMIATHLIKIIEECISVEMNSSWASEALRCLAICIEAYPYACGAKKNEIETYLLQFLCIKTQNAKVIEKAASIFQNIQMTGDAGPESINHQKNWSFAFERLCVTMDHLYDHFLEEVDEFQRNERLALEPYTFAELRIVINPTEKLYILENRLENLYVFLRGMLENEFSGRRIIRPRYVIDIITRALSIHQCVNHSDIDIFQFNMLLLKHQVSVLKFLRALITNCELGNTPYLHPITKLLVGCLKKTKKCNCFNHESQYKVNLYGVLEYWIEDSNNCTNKYINDKIILLIMGDICPRTKHLLLIMTRINRICQNKKHKAIVSKLISSFTKNAKAKNGVCYSALSCLLSIIKKNVIFKQDTYELLYKILCQVIMAVQNENQILPYASANAKVKLYETLVALIECSPPCALDLGLIVDLLRDGKKNNNKSISLTCCKGLRALDKFHQICRRRIQLHE